MQNIVEDTEYNRYKICTWGGTSSNEEEIF